MEMFRQGPDREGPHRPASEVQCEGSSQFLLSLRLMDMC